MKKRHTTKQTKKRVSSRVNSSQRKSYLTLILATVLVISVVILGGLYYLGISASTSSINLVSGNKLKTVIGDGPSQREAITSKTTPATFESKLGGGLIEEKVEKPSVTQAIVTGAQVVVDAALTASGGPGAVIKSGVQTIQSINNVRKEPPLLNKQVTDGTTQQESKEESARMEARDNHSENFNKEGGTIESKLGSGYKGTDGEGNHVEKVVTETPNEQGGVTTITKTLKVDKDTGKTIIVEGTSKTDSNGNTTKQVTTNGQVVFQDSNKKLSNIIAGGASQEEAKKKPSSNSPSSDNGTNPAKLCKAGNVTVASGTWVATGYGLDENGAHCDSSGCRERECVQVGDGGDGCGNGPRATCSSVYETNPTAIVLPSSGGPEYSQGLVVSDRGYDPNKKPDANCINDGETVPTGNVRPERGDESYCSNGAWVTQEVFNKDQFDLLEKSNQERLAEMQGLGNSMSIRNTEGGNNTNQGYSYVDLWNAFIKATAGPAGVPGAMGIIVNQGIGALIENFGPNNLAPLSQTASIVTAGVPGVPQAAGTVTAVIPSLFSRAPDSGVADNVVGLASGIGAAVGATPICVSVGAVSTFLAPITTLACEGAAFGIGAFAGSKATDTLLYLINGQENDKINDTGQSSTNQLASTQTAGQPGGFSLGNVNEIRTNANPSSTRLMSDLNYFNQNNYSGRQNTDGSNWSETACGIMSGAMIMSLKDPNFSPDDYNRLIEAKGGLSSAGSGWEDQHKPLLEEQGFTVKPLTGSTPEIVEKIREYTNNGTPVWINSNINTAYGTRGFGHQTIAVGVCPDQSCIILNDPYYGQNYEMPLDRFDINCTLGCDSNRSTWNVNAIIAPE